MIETHLQSHHSGYEHHRHATAMTAQELAAAEHVSGYKVAKPVVVKLDGKLALRGRRGRGAGEPRHARGGHRRRRRVVPEAEFAALFTPCDSGAEPPLSLFGIPIFADEKFLHARKVMMPAGTHEDSIVLDTHEWIHCEKVQPIANLGARAAAVH